ADVVDVNAETLEAFEQIDVGVESLLGARFGTVPNRTRRIERQLNVVLLEIGNEKAREEVVVHLVKPMRAQQIDSDVVAGLLEAFWLSKFFDEVDRHFGGCAEIV